MAGATLAVLEAPPGGGAPREVDEIRTGPDGSYRLELPDGPSRRVTIAYRPRPGGGFAASWATDVVVRLPLALRASRSRLRNGQVLRLSARVPLRRLRPRAASVAFQVLIGRRWKTFAVRPLSRSGLAATAHRFRYTFIAVRYRFRARLVPRAGFGFVPTTSAVVPVLVRPGARRGA